MNSIKLQTHSSGFRFLKALGMLYNFKETNIYWIFFSRITRCINKDYLRSSLYKLSLNRLVSNNKFLLLNLGCCYMQSGNYDLAIKYIHELSQFKDPMIFL